MEIVDSILKCVSAGVVVVVFVIMVMVVGDLLTTKFLRKRRKE